MATLEDFSKEYANRLKKVERSRRVSELKKIKKEIDSLYYERTGKRLTEEDKDKICEGIKSEFISCMRSFSRGYGTLAESSNDEFVKLIEMILRGR